MKLGEKSIKKQICFHGNENTDSQIKESRHESTGLWLGKGIASFIIPGLGQFIDERKKIGFIHLGIDISLFALEAIFSKKLISDITIKEK